MISAQQIYSGQHALQREVLYLVDQGIAAPEEVDRVVKFGFGFLKEP